MIVFAKILNGIFALSLASAVCMSLFMLLFAGLMFATHPRFMGDFYDALDGLIGVCKIAIFSAVTAASAVALKYALGIWYV